MINWWRLHLDKFPSVLCFKVITMDSFEEEQLANNFEYPDSHVLVAFIVPSDSSIETAKNLFCAVACEIGLRTTQNGKLCMQADCNNPFSACIKMVLQMHPTKGCMAVLRYKRKHFTLLSVNSFLASPLPPSCSNESWESCNEWWGCRIHGEAGLVAFYHHFFDKFKKSIIQSGISFVPLDSLPVCLEGTYLGVNYPQTGILSFQEKQLFYMDIPQSAIDSNRQWVIDIQSTKKISLAVKYNEAPGLFSSDHTQNCSKFGDSFRIICILDKYSIPKLCAGRWFLSVKGSCLFFKSSFKISCKCKFNLFILFD